MVTIRIGALADSGDLYPFIPMMDGMVRPEGFNIEIETIQTVQQVNEMVLKKDVDVSVPSAAMYPYIQDDYYILSNAVASAVDGITGMPILSLREMKLSDLSKSKLIVHGQNTTAFTLYRLLIGKYGKLIIVPKVLEEVKALGREGDVLVAVHEVKVMYAMRKLNITPHVVASMWDLWRRKSSAPMPMGMVVISKEFGKETAIKFKEFYEKSKKFSEKNLDNIVKRDIEIMREIQGKELDEEIIRKTIHADIAEYNVPEGEVMRGLSEFYRMTHENAILPKVKNIDVI
jgi:predicted solute-binding protein